MIMITITITITITIKENDEEITVLHNVVSSQLDDDYGTKNLET